MLDVAGLAYEYVPSEHQNCDGTALHTRRDGTTPHTRKDRLVQS